MENYSVYIYLNTTKANISSPLSLYELNWFIHKGTITPTLLNVTQTIDSIHPQASSFTLNYIYSITTIHAHIRLFESVLVKIIDDYAASACPNRDFLRHHNASAAGWRVKMYALSTRYTICKFSDCGSAAVWNATVSNLAGVDLLGGWMMPRLRC